MDLRIFESREHIKYFIQNAKYDKNIDYWSYAKYIKDEKLRLEYEKICRANGLISLYCTCANSKFSNVNLYNFVHSNDYRILLNAFNKTEKKEILSGVFGIDNSKNLSIINNGNNKYFYKLAIRSFMSSYRAEKNNFVIHSVVKKISNDYNFYFTLDDKLKRNNIIIQTLLDNAKYRVNNYGEVLPYVSNPSQMKQLKELIKRNSYCALYLFNKTGSTNIPNQDFDNECIKDIINKELILIDKNNPMYKIGKYVLKHVDSDYTKVVNDYIGINGRCRDLNEILKKYSDINLSDMKKNVRYLSHKALTKHVNPIIPIAAIIVAGSITVGALIKNSIDHNNAVDELSNAISNSEYFLDDYGSIDGNIEDNSIYDEALGDEAYTFITVSDLNSRDKIDEIIKSGKSAGIIIRPNTTSFDDFNRNMTNLAIYYNYYNKLKLPVLCDITALKDNMNLNCEFASQFLAVMDKLGIKAGLYGDEAVFNDLNAEYNKYDNKYKNITSFDNLVILNNMDNLESNLKRLSSEYNASMVQLPNGYIIFNEDYVDSYAGELFTNYVLDENETLDDVAYKLNLPIDYLCDINHFSSPSDVGVGGAIKIPKSYSKIGKIGPGSPLLANLDNGDNVIKGIDVSTWNPDVDWKKMKEKGVGFAVLRVADCYTRNVEDPYVVDDELVKNIKGCIENDIPYSFYYYTRAESPDEAALEAKFVSRILNELGYNSCNIFVDIETQKIDSGKNITLDEKIQTHKWKETEEECKKAEEECKSIIRSAIEGFKENGYNLCFYCGNTVYDYINQWFPGETFWITSHETYSYGAYDSKVGLTINDGFIFESFSYPDIKKKYFVGNEGTPIFQLTQYGKFNGIFESNGLPKIFDIDYASENFIDKYFYKGTSINLHLEDGAKVR